MDLLHFGVVVVEETYAYMCVSSIYLYAYVCNFQPFTLVGA